MAMTWMLESDDLQVSGGKLRLATGVEEIKQRIIVTLRHYWQEYFLNVPAGVPWYEVILGSKDRKLVEAILRRAVLDVPGVVGVINIRTTNTQRTFTVYIDVETEEGSASISTIVQE